MSQQPLAPPDERASGPAHQVVHSPEQVRLELPLAGPTSRLLAYGIDYVAILLLEAFAFVALAMTLPLTKYVEAFLEDLRRPLESGDPRALTGSSSFLMIFGFVVIVQLAIEWGYFILSETTSQGRSLGKAIVKLRVVGDGGHPLRFGQSVVRNLLRAVDILPGYYAVGLVAMIASDAGKRLGDLAAGTVVIRLDRPATLPTVDLHPAPGSEAFRFSHEQIRRFGRAEQRLVRQTLRRLPELSAQQAEIALERAVEVVRERIDHEPVEAAARQDFLLALLYTVDRR